MSDIELSRVGSDKVSATPPRAPGAPEPISRAFAPPPGDARSRRQPEP